MDQKLISDIAVSLEVSTLPTWKEIIASLRATIARAERVVSDDTKVPPAPKEVE